MSYKQLIDKDKVDKYSPEKFDKFFNVAMTSTLQEEFYSKKSEQTEETIKIHKEAIKDNRKIYSLSLLLPINDIHKMLIIKNLIEDKEVVSTDKITENNIILDCLKKMPIHRAYKTLYMLALNKTNNARTKWISRQFIIENKQHIYTHALKYKRLLKVIFRHNHIMTEKLLGTAYIDVERFIFKKDMDKITDKDFKNYIKAKTDKEAVFKLPYSVAVGFKNLHKIDDKEFMEKIKGKLTINEQKRIQNKAQEVGVKVDVDLTKYNLVDLFKYFRSKPGEKLNDIKLADLVHKRGHIEGKPLKEYFMFDQVSVLVDSSKSMEGSDEKKYHPISVAQAVSFVLAELGKKTTIIDETMFNGKPKGHTEIGRKLLELLKNLDMEKENLVVVVSDGFENNVEGMTHQILYAYKKKIDKKDKVLILHLNPVFDPKTGNVRKLSELMKTYGIRDTRQLFMILLLALVSYKNDKKLKKTLKGLEKKVTVRKRKKKVSKK